MKKPTPEAIYKGLAHTQTPEYKKQVREFIEDYKHRKTKVKSRNELLYKSDRK